MDVDTGIDDAVALLLVRSVLGEGLRMVSAVSGNVPVERALENTRRVLHLSGADEVPVFHGASAPLVAEPMAALWVHGEDGLGGVELEPSPAPPAGGLDELRAALEREPAPVALLATAPLTNAALLARWDPRLFARRVERIVWMGGSWGRGNDTPAAEFNARVDPEAVHIVAGSGVPMTMVGLNATEGCPLDDGDMERIGAVATRSARLVATMLGYEGLRRVNRDFGGVVVHDAIAAATLLWPGEVTATRRYPLTVDLSHGPSYGATLTGPVATGPEVEVAVAADRVRFAQRLASALARLP